jgi:hypothetical protein
LAAGAAPVCVRTTDISFPSREDWRNSRGGSQAQWRPGDAVPRQSGGLQAIQARKSILRDSPAFGAKLLELAVAFCASTGRDQAPALALSYASSIDLPRGGELRTARENHGDSIGAAATVTKIARGIASMADAS